jgi:hypothetical protein
MRSLDPELLTPELKGFLQHLDYLAMPDENGPPAPGGVPVHRFQMFADPLVRDLLEVFVTLPAEQRRIVVEMVRTVARELAS